VARFEPENHVVEILEGYHRSTAELPLVVVGSAPYAEEYTRRVTQIADSDDRISLLGGVWDQELLDALYHHAFTYLHGHSVGGTNPSLLRAIGAGTSVIGYDVDFNREIVGDHGRFFLGPDGVADALRDAESVPSEVADSGNALRELARTTFEWDEVARQYADLAQRLVEGHSIHPTARRIRRRG
jgi:glycosyltransferase involved in cell wall biosynthesis